MSNSETSDRLSLKLDILIGLLLKLRPQPKNEKEDVLYLFSAGLRSEEIARALGKTPNSVYLILSRNRKKAGSE